MSVFIQHVRLLAMSLWGTLRPLPSAFISPGGQMTQVDGEESVLSHTTSITEHIHQSLIDKQASAGYLTMAGLDLFLSLTDVVV